MKQKIIIGWLYPELMSTYGDRGNIIALQKRSEWRAIEAEILSIGVETTAKELKTVDLLFGGGAQDRQQEIVMRDLKKEKKEMIKELVENNAPALFVCGAPQLMGNYYEPGFGERIEGLGIFNMDTKHPGIDKERLIGNIMAKLNSDVFGTDQTIVGFENHGGRTHLLEGVKPFAKVVKGFGNNGEDGTEGVVYKNAIGCYFHGPLLPKNPYVADWLIKKSLEVKYKEEVKLKELDDSLEQKAHEAIAQKILKL